MKRLLWVVAFVLVAGAAFIVDATGVHWQDGYRALEAAETNLPAGQRERERYLLMNAQADGPPPVGMPIEHRVRDAGSLVRVRYEFIGSDAQVTDTVEIRALVPALPYFGADAPGSDLGRVECPSECREQLARRNAVLLPRSGDPGLAGEWLLRMPVGRAFDLGLRSLRVQDIEAKTARSLPSARVRVTLLEACPARVRQGSISKLDFIEGATVPLPNGWHARRWIQLEGCAAMMRQAPIGPPPDAAAAARAARALQPPVRMNSDAYSPDPTLEGVRPLRLHAQGFASLVVDDDWQARHGRPMHFRMLRACRYDPAANRWQALPLPGEAGDIAPLARKAPRSARIAFRFPEEPGLFWAEWSETDQAPVDKPREHRTLVYAGSDLDCDVSQARAAQADEIMTCVPRRLQRAEARVLPAPQTHCSR